MALKYKIIFKVPEGFENLLNDFAKEILRNKPNDILDFGIWYFQGLENNQDPTKMDYPFKGTNLPEQFKSQGYQIPKIISAENKLSISNRDNLRLDKSMKKSQEINSTNVPLRDDVFRQQGKNDQIVENFGVENYHFIEGGIPNNNEYKVHNNPTDREFNINEVNGSGFNYKEGQFPNKIDDFEMGYNYRGGLKEIRGVKFPEMKKEGIILKDDNIKNVEEFIKTGGMATTTEKIKEKKEVKKKEKVVKPPDFNTKDYDDRSSNFPDSNKDKIVEDTVSKLGINPDKTQNQFDDEKNDDEKYDDDSSNAPDSNKDKIIQHTASMLNKKINANEEFKNMEDYNNEIRETNQENLLESHEFNNNVNVETSSEKIEIKVIEKDGKRTVEIRRNGEEIGEDELPEEYKIQLENMKNHLNEEENNENVEEYNENIEHNENVDENNNNENVDENNNNENVDENNNNENVDENNNENIEEYKENIDDENKNENNENIEENNNLEENNVNNEENNVNNEENNVNNEENNNENIEEYKENIEHNENVDENNENIEHNENVDENNENIEQNNENIEEYKENIEQNENVDENNENIDENNNENNNINQANKNEDFIDENQITNNNENTTENNKNQYVIETVTETKTNENGEKITEKRLIVTKNGVEISRDEIPAEIQQQLNLIQQQIDEGKAKIETVENTGKIENTNKEIKSEINKEGEEEIIETTTKEVKELKDGQVVNEQKTVTTKKRKRRGENEEGLESDTDNEFGNENENENVPEEEN